MARISENDYTRIYGSSLGTNKTIKVEVEEDESTTNFTRVRRTKLWMLHSLQVWMMILTLRVPGYGHEWNTWW